MRDEERYFFGFAAGFLAAGFFAPASMAGAPASMVGAFDVSAAVGEPLPEVIVSVVEPAPVVLPAAGA